MAPVPGPRLTKSMSAWPAAARISAAMSAAFASHSSTPARWYVYCGSSVRATQFR